MMTGKIFNIQRFSIHDGPGIRTTVFFKGCPLRCQWCHNPEGMTLKPVLFLDAQICLACGRCLPVCPADARGLDEQGKIVFSREKCIVCGRCAQVCPAKALELAGETRTVEDVLAVLLRDRAFYENSGGGITLSGGDPLFQPEFALALLQACKDNHLATAIETSAHIPWDIIGRIAPYVDLWLCDLKHVDPEKHRQFTGVDNRLILENLRKIAAESLALAVRIPVVPGFNDSPAEIRALGEFLKTLTPVPAVELLAFHHLGESKYRRLGIPYPMTELAALPDDSLAPLWNILMELGLKSIADQSAGQV
jgi:pyruvate formate lyase activating enzyme